MSVSAFANFLVLSREQPLLGPDEIINDASKHNYTIGKFISGRPKTVIKGGQYLTERVKLLKRSSFRNYVPGEDRNPGRSQTNVSLKWPYRFSESDIAWTDAEVMLCQAANGQREAFKSLRRSLRNDAAQDHWDGMEEKLWAVPSYSNMEVDTPGVPGEQFSIPTFITETDGAAPGWTTSNNLGGAPPATYDNWDNQREDYDPANPYGDNGIFAAFDRMFLDLRWAAAPRNKDAFTEDNLDRLIIFTNKNGVTMFSQGLRNANDQTRAGPQDPSYGKPQFMGVPIDWAAELDTQLLDERSGSYQTQAYPDGYPRYFFVNAKYLYPAFHAERFMMEKGPISGGVRQHDTEALFYVTWWNLICLSRRRQGLVFPE